MPSSRTVGTDWLRKYTSFTTNTKKGITMPLLRRLMLSGDDVLQNDVIITSSHSIPESHIVDSADMVENTDCVDMTE